MISILIPVYNRDVNELVQALSKQVALLQQEAEIIVLDDGSEPSYRYLHQKLHELPYVRYFESLKNNGRIRIRQMIAAFASYKWLLFLDCDSEIISDRYLDTFLLQIKDRWYVLMGGRIYSSEKPADCSLRLHWKYGTIREKTYPGKKGTTNRFMTNNFCIPKTAFDRFDFKADWGGYGYEDTWMGIQLEAMGIPIVYIDNPVMHKGLESSGEFLAKSNNALQNLKILSELVPGKILTKHVRLYSYYCRLRFMGLLWIVNLFYRMFHAAISKNIHSCNPSLRLFDLYRLHYFAVIKEITLSV